MAARDTGKLCTRCGQFKPPTDFYVHGKTRSGLSKLSPKCKQCHKRRAADRKRKGGGTYRTLDQIRANRKPRRLKKKSEFGKWSRVLVVKSGRDTSPWGVKLETCLSSLRKRRAGMGKSKRRVKSWTHVLSQSLGKTRKRSDDCYGEWRSKLESVATNIATRQRAASNEEAVVGVASKTAVQMRFDW